MNADGHPAVAADFQAEVTLPWFRQATRLHSSEESHCKRSALH